VSATFQVYEDSEGLYRFQLKAANGVVVADSHPYRTVADVRRGREALQRAAGEADVPPDDADVEVQSGIHMHFAVWPREERRP
jgi:uncharacterized protein YegP (UPF0339 family)